MAGKRICLDIGAAANVCSRTAVQRMSEPHFVHRIVADCGHLLALRLGHGCNLLFRQREEPHDFAHVRHLALSDR